MVIYFSYGIRNSTQKAQNKDDDRIIKIALVDLTQKISDIDSKQIK